ncbi:unnamed protein product [Closterium sp. NIES-64]|nr:unnamed protein product [Closterium sp. NIES-64]
MPRFLPYYLICCTHPPTPNAPDPLLVPAANEVSAARRQGAGTIGKDSSGDGNEVAGRDRNGAGGVDRSQAGGEVKLEGRTAGKNSRVPSLFSPTIPRLPVTSTSSLLAAARAHPVASPPCCSPPASPPLPSATNGVSPASPVIDLTQDCDPPDPAAAAPPCCSPPVPSALPPADPPEADKERRGTGRAGGKRRRDVEEALQDGRVEDRSGMGRRGAEGAKGDDAERRMEGGDAAMRIGDVEMRMNGTDSERKIKGGDAGKRKASGEGRQWSEQQTEADIGLAGAGEAGRGAALGDGDCLRDPSGCGSGGAPPRTGDETAPMGQQRGSRGASQKEESSAGPRGECLAPEGPLRSRGVASCQGGGAGSRRAAALQGNGAGSLATRDGNGAKKSLAAKEEENRRAREYLSVVQTSLPPPDFQTFLCLLREFRKSRAQVRQPPNQQQQQPVFSSASQPAAAVPVGVGAVVSGGAVLATRSDLLHSLASLFAASNQLPLLAG